MVSFISQLLVGRRSRRHRRPVLQRRGDHVLVPKISSLRSVHPFQDIPGSQDVKLTRTASADPPTSVSCALGERRAGHWQQICQPSMSGPLFAGLWARLSVPTRHKRRRLQSHLCSGPSISVTASKNLPLRASPDHLLCVPPAQQQF